MRPPSTTVFDEVLEDWEESPWSFENDDSENCFVWVEDDCCSLAQGGIFCNVVVE